MSISIPVEKVVIIIQRHAMVLAPKIEFFAVINVYQKTAGKNIYSLNNRIMFLLKKKIMLTYKS